MGQRFAPGDIAEFFLRRKERLERFNRLGQRGSRRLSLGSAWPKPQCGDACAAQESGLAIHYQHLAVGTIIE